MIAERHGVAFADAEIDSGDARGITAGTDDAAARLLL
jgi:hypothetical protein